MLFGFWLAINSQGQNQPILKMANIVTKTKCRGSGKTGPHYLIKVNEKSPILICIDVNCDFMYYNIESGEWHNKPVLKNSQKPSINQND